MFPLSYYIILFNIVVVQVTLNTTSDPPAQYSHCSQEKLTTNCWPVISTQFVCVLQRNKRHSMHLNWQPQTGNLHPTPPILLLWGFLVRLFLLSWYLLNGKHLSTYCSMGNFCLWDNNDFASHVRKKNSLGPLSHYRTGDRFVLLREGTKIQPSSRKPWDFLMQTGDIFR